jgi:hypothetical protein
VHDTLGHPCDLNPKAKVVQRRLKCIQFRYDHTHVHNTSKSHVHAATCLSVLAVVIEHCIIIACTFDCYQTHANDNSIMR